MNTKKPHFDIYQHVTDKIIAALEAGTAPWLKPWNNPESCLGLPKNAVSNRLYSGINILLLWLAAEEKGYRQSKWITALNVKKLGGYIRKGEKATIAVMYQPIEREKLDDNGEVILNDEGKSEMEKFVLIKKHNLFNIEQCENLPQNLYDTETALANIAGSENQYKIFGEIRQIIRGMELDIKIQPSNKAFYHAETDKVLMPEMKQFNSEQDFYSTLLHEVTHATGHPSRLNREGITSHKAKFGNKLYAFEELIAEMGSSFLCAHLGFDTTPQNASYIKSWIEVLKQDKKAIFRASGKAREAYEYMFDILNVSQQCERYNIAF